MPLERRSTDPQNSGGGTSDVPGSAKSHTSPAFTPASVAHSARVSRLGWATPARSSRSAASWSAREIEERGHASGTQPLLLSLGLQRRDQLLEPAVQHVGQIVRRIADPVIGDAILREVVGADFGGPVARAHLRAPLPGPLRLLLGDH